APALQAGCQQFDPVIAHQTLFKELEHEGFYHCARFLFIFAYNPVWRASHGTPLPVDRAIPPAM
ncbi:hypothetical protein LIQ46_10895, partial [Megasphaera elsdenii]|uniref:hypothetical protein n=1 Tax=Megasphaera elsdenii TaxID=907 RepID=UPI001D0307C6